MKKEIITQKLDLDDLEHVVGGVGYDAPYDFLDSIPDKDLRRAWAIAFAWPQNFDNWDSYSAIVRNDDNIASLMENAEIKGLSVREFKRICLQAMQIARGKADYPVF